MRIAIEAQRIFRNHKHGMDFVALETIRQLQRIDSVNEYFIFVSPGPDKCLEATPNFHIIELKCPSYPLWEQIALPMAVRKYRIDILHCTSNTAPIWCGAKLILTLHDIIFLEPRQGSSKSIYQNLGWHYRRLVVPRIISKCSRLITVSEFERERISKALDLNSDKIVTLHNGYSEHFKVLKNFGNIVRNYIEAEHYLFFLGNTDPKKNVARTLHAYSRYLSESRVKLPLLIADLTPGNLKSILKEERLEHLNYHIKLSGYIRNSDLPALYNGAFAFLYTSLRESFGLPILEAMACSTPVITGNTSAMPEIAGENGILIDTSDEKQIADSLLRLESDLSLYETQKEYGLSRVKDFSWKNSAKKLLSIYKSIDLK